MNKKDRSALEELMAKLEVIKEEIEGLDEYEREKFDNLPEGIQASDRGQAIEAAADSLDGIVADLENVLDSYREME